MKIWVTLTCIAFLYCYAEGTDEFSDILANVPDDEMHEFLKYHINLGYHLTKIDITRNKKIPQEITNFPPSFSISLYKYYHEQKLKTGGTEAYIPVCTSKGCVEISDPGIHP